MKDPSLMDKMEKEIAGEAWDRGWDTAAACYWHKPRNPFTGELNDDAIFYCPEHGGTATPETCDHNDHPIPEPPECICEGNFRKQEGGAVVGMGGWVAPSVTTFEVGGPFFGPHHQNECPYHVIPASLPEIKVMRGGLRFDRPKED